MTRMVSSQALVFRVSKGCVSIMAIFVLSEDVSSNHGTKHAVGGWSVWWLDTGIGAAISIGDVMTKAGTVRVVFGRHKCCWDRNYKPVYCLVVLVLFIFLLKAAEELV